MFQTSFLYVVLFCFMEPNKGPGISTAENENKECWTQLAFLDKEFVFSFLGYVQNERRKKKMLKSMYTQNVHGNTKLLNSQIYLNWQGHCSLIVVFLSFLRSYLFFNAQLYVCALLLLRVCVYVCVGLCLFCEWVWISLDIINQSLS